ncbi:MAG: KpsF/GutQ family sugar-phosphate isomerase, partial [Campylobacteraceae bacterium]|jgi:CBS domain-containing protein|nr:KpsF/GutQ family sugar-phosphate isomerase [Campylobacteraceae bacterium]
VFLEQYKIQLLVIVNKDNIPIGVLHIHDLIEAGIS